MKNPLSLPRAVAPLAVGAVLALGAGAALVACGSGDGPKRSDAAATRSAAPAGAPALSVVDPYIPQPSSPDVAAGYLTIRNDGDTADRLVSVTSPISGDVMLHETKGNSMAHLPRLDLPAHGSGVLARGGRHIMFMQPERQLRKGDTVQLTLNFERSGPITVDVPVLGVTERPGDKPSVTSTGGAHDGHAGS